jgi:hypothetical protein
MHPGLDKAPQLAKAIYDAPPDLGIPRPFVAASPNGESLFFHSDEASGGERSHREVFLGV